MSITESKIRQIIREEARRVLREGSDDDLPGPRFPPGSVRRPGLEKFASFEPPDGWDDEEEDGSPLEIERAEWFDLYNDASTSSQGGEIEIDYVKDGESQTAKVNVNSYISPKEYIVELIADALGVSEQEARTALGPKLDDIMNELDNSERIYQQDAESNW